MAEAGDGEPTDTEVADPVLVRRVLAGSQAALATLYDRHADVIFARALRLARDRATAEEVVQETFLALWNRAALFDPTRGTLAGWLLTIARNRSVDRVRASGRRVPAAPFSSLLVGRSDDASSLDWLMDSSDPVGGARADPGPEVALLRRETRAAVREAVAGLPAPERQAILLAYRDGLSQSEIATRLGWPLGTVKTRTRRALQALRGALDESQDETADAGAQSRAATSRSGRPTTGA